MLIGSSLRPNMSSIPMARLYFGLIGAFATGSSGGFVSTIDFITIWFGSVVNVFKCNVNV